MRSTPRTAHVARSAALGVALTALAAGCAGVSEVTGTASQQDLLQIRSDVSVLQANMQRTRAEMEKQSREIEAYTRNEAAPTRERLDDLGRRVEALATTLTGLTGRIDEMNARLEALGRRVETAAAAPPAPPPPPPREQVSAQPPPSRTPGRAPVGGVQPQDLYQTAYIDFSKGSYALAIAGFREFLRRYPDHELAGSAQYWIGEAHFSLARAQPADKAGVELERAVQEFRKVLSNYPRSDKAPTALYKEALTLIELKQPAQAQHRLQYLIDTFPQAEETPLARERLGTLKGS